MTEWSSEHFAALFEPRGIIVAGASTHPGKFGFVVLHNILTNGYEGRVFATNLDGAPVLGIDTVATIDELPTGAADLLFVCTPARTNVDLLGAAAAKGVKAAFIASGGYAEAGADGLAAQHELIRVADELGVLVAGPNGQGVISTPAKLCAQIVAPFPPSGAIGIASQSGNLVSSFENLAAFYGVGVSRAVSAGNAAGVDVADYLEWYAGDPATTVGLAYVEGLPDGRRFVERMARVSQQMPVVLVKGGVSDQGARAAASHTGSLASNDRVFDGAVAQAGVVRAKTIEEAYDAAATFATQPLPRGPRVAVVTTVGGWGVIASDAIATTKGLELLSLPPDLESMLDNELPPRWSRNNPIDLAGGETRDTIPTVLEAVASHPDVDAVLVLGLGIQANQARLERDGRFYPDHGLERIVEYHERQDHRFATVAAEVRASLGKPVLVASELAITNPDNPAIQACRDAGFLAYASANRAVASLGHLWRYAEWRRRRNLPTTNEKENLYA